MTQRPHILVVDANDRALRNFVCACVTARGYLATGLSRPADAPAWCRAERPAAVLINLPPQDPTPGLDAVSALHEDAPDMPVIVFSGEARTPETVEAVRRGAVDFISVPFDETDLELVLARALAGTAAEPPASRDQAPPPPHAVLVGQSAPIERVRAMMQQVAATDAPLMIHGESGTGKTTVARAIVAASPRANRPFVTVTCSPDDRGPLAPDLVASAALGMDPQHESVGNAFEAARGGTLYLEEVADLGSAQQSRLLEIVMNGQASPAARESAGDIRIIGATGRNMERMVAEGRFREDLFFRLNVIAIRLPPLRERREDIPVLTRHFLDLYSAHYGVPAPDISPATTARFMTYPWPGNVQELDNLVRRAVLLGSDESLTRTLGAGGTTTPPDAVRWRARSPEGEGEAAGLSPLRERARMAAREAERTLIQQALEQTHWNRKEAASLLGISYKALLNKLKKADLT